MTDRAKASAFPALPNMEAWQRGMSIREAFALAAMQGILARDAGHTENTLRRHEVAELAVHQADALLAALEKL